MRPRAALPRPAPAPPTPTFAYGEAAALLRRQSHAPQKSGQRRPVDDRVCAGGRDAQRRERREGRVRRRQVGQLLRGAPKAAIGVLAGGEKVDGGWREGGKGWAGEVAGGRTPRPHATPPCDARPASHPPPQPHPIPHPTGTPPHLPPAPLPPLPRAMRGRARTNRRPRGGTRQGMHTPPAKARGRCAGRRRGRPGRVGAVGWVRLTRRRAHPLPPAGGAAGARPGRPGRPASASVASLTCRPVGGRRGARPRPSWAQC